jgi:hypothetical protein
MALAWLAVVAVASAVTWGVIDAAGRGVLGSGGPDSLQAADLTSTAEPATVAPAPTLSRSPHASGGPRPTRTGGVGPTGGSPTSTPPLPPAATASTPPEQDLPAARGQVGSWVGPGGEVTAACTGSTIDFRSATPSDGWGREVKDEGPHEVEVEFESGGDDRRRTEVVGLCVGGRPGWHHEIDD